MRIKRSEIHKVRSRIQEEQHNCCAICGGSFTAYTYHGVKRKVVPKYKATLDHDHDSGAVRGVLCSYCNSVEGKIKGAIRRYHPYAKVDPAAFLYELATYLDLHKINVSGVIHPDHKTQEEKAERARLQARKRYAAKKSKEDKDDA